MEFEHARPEDEYEALLVICGCGRACADINPYKTKYGSVYICTENGSEGAANELERLL
jgi:hypothetical protein